MGVRLPPEYQEVEFITANGNQYFWSDVLIQDGLTVDAIQTFNGGDSYLFGGHADGTGRNSCAYNGTYANSIQSAYPSYWTASRVMYDGTIYHVVSTFDGGHSVIYIDDIKVDERTSGYAVQTTGKYCAVFCQRASGDGTPGTTGNFYRGNVYSLKVSKGNNILADYVPCYRKSDGEIGMFDLVLQKFYANEGTGVFLKGNDVIDSISPWMVTRRRALMGTSIEPEINPFITITNAFSNAFDAKTEIDALMAYKGITENNKIIVGKLISNSNNRMVAKDWINLNGALGNYVRERNGALMTGLPWGTASYDSVASVGDEYYVIDPLNIQRGGTFRIRASQNYTNAETVLSFIRDNMPDNSLYAVIRKFDPSELVLYDCIAIFLDSSQQAGLRAGSTKKTSDIPAWTAGYDCKIYSGDELYYIKIETRT